jgi:leucyl aminopeptidase
MFGSILSIIVLGFSMQGLEASAPVRIMAGTDLLEAAGIVAPLRSEKIGVGIVNVSEAQLTSLSEISHREFARCGGFEQLDVHSGIELLEGLEHKALKQEHYYRNSYIIGSEVEKKEWIATALLDIKADRLGGDMEWLSSYATRYHRSKNKNEHVYDLKERLEEIVKDVEYPISIDTIEHKRTKQLSLRLSIEGKDRPEEKVILGGHLDSISRPFTKAPGADDNASGSSSLIEALRVVITHEQPERSVEFFWYAGEEAGLLGSKEIAKTYRDDDERVISVLQLDMTSYPGSGEFVIGLMTDYTTAWLTQYLKDLNEIYVGAEIKETRCGYACSDHASWFRQDFPTVFPHEATMSDGSHYIHTSKDIISNGLDFKHAAIFAELALVYVLDMANSQTQSKM